MENPNQIDGYVYVARIIDHGGKFVNGYHKIGLSKQYKIRETQLNSTHLPFDVLMIRVFETTNMKQLEGMLHICFEDYRVVKEYNYRKNITTEWFDVNDIDVFNERIDKFTELMSIYGTKEIDISRSIDSDITMTSEEKEQTKENIGRAKGSNLKIEIDSYDLSGDTAKIGFVNFVKKVIEKIGRETVSVDFADVIKDNKNDFASYVRPSGIVAITDTCYLNAHSNTQSKKNIMEKMISKYSLNAFVSIIQ
jgi:hypothetical protein